MMTDCRDDRCGALRKSMETLRRKVSDRHDGCAGRTIEGMKVRRRCLSYDTWKKKETLKTVVSDNHDG